jgi:uncharacterized membrane protein YkvA (DUF1232 family)
MRLPGRRRASEGAAEPTIVVDAATARAVPANPEALAAARNVTPAAEDRRTPRDPVAPPPPAAPDAPEHDPFPRDEVGRFVRRMPAYAHLAWNLARDPAVSKSKRAAVLAAAGYLISPIDLVPGFIPVLGQLDDLLVLIAALRLALSGLDSEQRAARLAAAHLSDELLAEDARALGHAGAWVARRGGRLAVKAGHRGVDTTADLARRTAPLAARGARTAGVLALKGAQRAGQVGLSGAQKVGQAGVSGAQKAGGALVDRVPGRGPSAGPEVDDRAGTTAGSGDEG